MRGDWAPSLPAALRTRSLTVAARWRSLGLATAALLLAGCGRYADFVLPAAAGGDPRATFEFVAHPGPVLGRGPGFDSRDVLNPSVARRGDLLNLYSGFDGRTWTTGAATSEDGLAWRKQIGRAHV